MDMKKYIIVIDEGHGGTDSGAVDLVNVTEGDAIATYEKDLNRKVGEKVIKKLKDMGIQVVSTRENDNTVSLGNRCKIANNAKADIFVAIHHNAGTSQAHGIETWIYRDSKNPLTQKLGENIHSEMVLKSSFTDRHLQKSGFYVLKNTNMPAALVELGFITNTKEEAIINTDQFQENLSDGIISGILKTLELIKK
jgi:N-acetylmuramoyl-L-alanine amidase